MRGITIAFSTPQSPTFMARYKRHVLRTIGLQRVEVLALHNPQKYSLARAYNLLLAKAKHKVVCLIHDDLVFHQKNWGRNILKAFERSDYGLLGVVGTQHLPEHGVYWEPLNHVFGQITYPQDIHRGQSKRNVTYSGAFEHILPALVVDGVLLAVYRPRFKAHFDERIPGFHFYDVALCVQAHLQGARVGVLSDLAITHHSRGQPDNAYHACRKVFLAHYQDELPLKLQHSPHIPRLGPFLNKKNLKIGVLTFGRYSAELSAVARKSSHCFEVFGVSGQRLCPPSAALSELWPVFLQHLSSEWDLVLLLNGWARHLNDCIRRLIQVYLRNPEQIGTLGVRYLLPNGHLFCEGLRLQKKGHGFELAYLGLNNPFGSGKTLNTVDANLAHCVLVNSKVLLSAHCPQSLQNWVPGYEISRTAARLGLYNQGVGDALAQIALPPSLLPAEARQFAQWWQNYPHQGVTS